MAASSSPTTTSARNAATAGRWPLAPIPRARPHGRARPPGATPRRLPDGPDQRQQRDRRAEPGRLEQVHQRLGLAVLLLLEWRRRAEQMADVGQCLPLLAAAVVLAGLPVIAVPLGRALGQPPEIAERAPQVVA